MSQERVRRVLASLLSGKAQCWVLFQENEEGRKEILSMLVSCMEIEQVTGCRFLNLWAMYAYRQAPLEIWQAMREAVEEFARAQGCDCITALTNNPKAVSLALGLGATSQTTFVVKEL